MIPHHIYYQLAIVGLLWLCVMLHSVWPNRGMVSPPPPVQLVLPQLKRKRSNGPKPFVGLIQRPHWPHSRKHRKMYSKRHGRNHYFMATARATL